MRISTATRRAGAPPRRRNRLPAPAEATGRSACLPCRPACGRAPSRRTCRSPVSVRGSASWCRPEDRRRPSSCPRGGFDRDVVASGAMLVKLIVTLPAFAESVLVLYSSCPLGFAERLTLARAGGGRGARGGRRGGGRRARGRGRFRRRCRRRGAAGAAARRAPRVPISAGEREEAPHGATRPRRGWCFVRSRSVLQSWGCRCQGHRESAILPADPGAARLMLRPGGAARVRAGAPQMAARLANTPSIAVRRRRGSRSGRRACRRRSRRGR